MSETRRPADPSVTPPRRRSLGIWLLTLAIAWSVTFTNQAWIGRATIYQESHVEARQRLHDIILTNRLPEGVPSWTSIGANGLNTRVLTVWVAEGLRRATGQPLERCYWVLETGALFIACLLLFAFIRSCTGTSQAFGALLYFGSVFPLTYLFHYFHPWDKPLLVAWLAALLLARHRRWVALAVVLAVGMFIKYDLIVFPLFVLLAEWRRSGWRRSLTLAASLSVVVFSVYVLLRVWIAPGGFEPRPWMTQVVQNLQGIRNYPLQYPPLLALGIPAALALYGYARSDDFMKAGVLMSGVMLVLFFLQVHFIEFRMQMAVLLLLLPAAMSGALRLVRPTAENGLTLEERSPAELGTR